jgi:EmrB/QacA subfamily drug resistance transporter
VPTETTPTSAAMRRLALTVLLAGGFLPPVDFFIVNVALPSIHSGLGASPAELQLVIGGYAAGYAVFMITGGRLGDLYGRRRFFLIGMAGFTLTNLLCGLAVSPLQLLLGRALQGVSAALLVPQVLGAIRALCANERDLAQALSAYGVMMGLAAVTGQFLGGALVQWSPFALGWRAVFLLKLPVCLVVIAAAWRLLPETSAASRARLDLPGAAMVSLILACLIVPLSEGRDQGWPTWVFAVLAVVPFLVALFLRYEAYLGARGGMPLVDLTLFAIPSFRRGVLVATLFFFTTSFYFLFGLYQQEGRGLDPLHTGLAIAPYGVGLFLGPLATANWERLRPRLLAIGMAIQVAGYGGVAVLVGLGTGEPPILTAVFIAGFGQGIAFPRLYNTVLGEVPAHQAGLAAGIVNSALQVGVSVSGAAIGSLFFSMLGESHTERDYAFAFAAAQITLTFALFTAMVIAIPGRREARAAPCVRSARGGR